MWYQIFLRFWFQWLLSSCLTFKIRKMKLETVKKFGIMFFYRIMVPKIFRVYFLLFKSNVVITVLIGWLFMCFPTDIIEAHWKPMVPPLSQRWTKNKRRRSATVQVVGEARTQMRQERWKKIARKSRVKRWQGNICPKKSNLGIG
jgi:hypothetical protein